MKLKNSVILFRRSWSWVPCSTREPLSSTAMLSAFRTVDSRCATSTMVRPPSPMSRSSACCTKASLSVSNELVASSSSKTFGRRRSIRAMAIRWIYPKWQIGYHIFNFTTKTLALLCTTMNIFWNFFLDTIIIKLLGTQVLTYNSWYFLVYLMSNIWSSQYTFSPLNLTSDDHFSHSHHL